MREFFKSLPFKIFLAVGLILIGLMLRTAFTNGAATTAESVLAVVVSPVQRLSSSISGFFYGVFSDMATKSQLQTENDALKKQVASMRSQLVDYNELQQENSQYKKMYGIAQENPDFKLLPARVVSRDSGQWTSAFTIDRGSLDGVKPYEPVVTSDGNLVGETVKVTATTSVVATILDPTVKVGAVVSETGDLVQARGDRTLAAKGLLYIDYLPKDSAASVGNILVSAGRAGTFPKNLKIGLIEQVKTQNEGMALYAVCKPLADPNTVRDVTVITDFNGKNALAAASSSSSK